MIGKWSGVKVVAGAAGAFIVVLFVVAGIDGSNDQPSPKTKEVPAVTAGPAAPKPKQVVHKRTHRRHKARLAPVRKSAAPSYTPSPKPAPGGISTKKVTSNGTCSDFSTQAEAQDAANTLDSDHDGAYCESLP